MSVWEAKSLLQQRQQCRKHDVIQETKNVFSIQMATPARDPGNELHQDTARNGQGRPIPLLSLTHED